MTKERTHYDGENPREPLPSDHFSEEERREGSQLGDGSPGVPRQDEPTRRDDAKDESPRSA